MAVRLVYLALAELDRLSQSPVTAPRCDHGTGGGPEETPENYRSLSRGSEENESGYGGGSERDDREDEEEEREDTEEGSGEPIEWIGPRDVCWSGPVYKRKELRGCSPSYDKKKKCSDSRNCSLCGSDNEDSSSSSNSSVSRLLANTLFNGIRTFYYYVIRMMTLILMTLIQKVM